eukprot:CAMPEP_0172609082 /NCGR_PEP_ID=MMETSP1068-20121228/29115_1 /TAXON_ID=35684 /ORGANISM="Pseudopedinella elastica, Strain CCMP716" /LENGTH=408 /DNA_ID=CAMNT_0013412523 /DNA_START=1 /DNA_END=1227 /DNA_ORIENTATION=-
MKVGNHMVNWCLSARTNDWHRLASAVANALKLHGMGVPGGQVYEFGIYDGHSMRSLWRTLLPFRNTTKPFMWGFDSFEGLPDYKEERVGLWKQGQYAADPRDKLTSLFPGEVGFVKGWYSVSLSDRLIVDRAMRPAMYLGVDCDLYESTVPVLDWAFRTGIARPGTMVGYDDWWVLPCGYGYAATVSPLASGEGRAHLEVSKKYDVEFVCAAGPCLLDSTRAQHVSQVGSCNPYSAWGVIFVVKSVGEGRANTGFHMTSQDMGEFMGKSETCARIRKKSKSGTVSVAVNKVKSAGGSPVPPPPPHPQNVAPSTSSSINPSPRSPMATVLTGLRESFETGLLSEDEYFQAKKMAIDTALSTLDQVTSEIAQGLKVQRPPFPPPQGPLRENEIPLTKKEGTDSTWFLGRN